MSEERAWSELALMYTWVPRLGQRSWFYGDGLDGDRLLCIDDIADQLQGIILCILKIFGSNGEKEMMR